MCIQALINLHTVTWAFDINSFPFSSISNRPPDTIEVLPSCVQVTLGGGIPAAMHGSTTSLDSFTVSCRSASSMVGGTTQKRALITQQSEKATKICQVFSECQNMQFTQ
jgi:hypothetical protein